MTTSFLVASVVLGQQSLGGGAQGAFDQPRLRGTEVQIEVWDSVKESVAILPDAFGKPFGLAVLIDSMGYYLAHSSAIVSEPVTALLEDGSEIRLGRIGFDATTQLVLLGAQNWERQATVPVSVGDPENPAKDMTMVTADGLVRSYLSKQNVPGVVQPTNRYLPLNEVQFESMSAPVGGALVFNRSGELMGILGATLTRAPMSENYQETATRFGPQALTVGYALSPKVIGRVVEGFRTESHQVQHPNIGILFKDNGIPAGAVVTQVQPMSPAAKAGLMVGDIVTHFGDKPVTGGLDLATMLFDKDPGETVEIKFLREGKDRKLNVEIGIDDSGFFH